MKKALLILACLAAAAASYAQGTVNFNTRSSAAVQLRALAADGTPLTGPNYTAQLWGGPANATEAQLQLVASSAFRTGSGAGWVNAGAVAVPGVAGGATATFQVRAIDTATGAAGASALFQVGPLGNPTAEPPTVPIDLLTAATSGSFSLSGPIIPEPTTIALGVLGAAALFLRRRS
jgi:hypothetical protein